MFGMCLGRIWNIQERYVYMYPASFPIMLPQKTNITSDTPHWFLGHLKPAVCTYRTFAAPCSSSHISSTAGARTTWWAVAVTGLSPAQDGPGRASSPAGGTTPDHSCPKRCISDLWFPPPLCGWTAQPARPLDCRTPRSRDDGPPHATPRTATPAGGILVARSLLYPDTGITH